MLFRYIGDKSGVNAFGYNFVGSEAVEVDDQHAIKKLSNNRFFEVATEDIDSPEDMTVEQMIEAGMTDDEIKAKGVHHSTLRAARKRVDGDN